MSKKNKQVDAEAARQAEALQAEVDASKAEDARRKSASDNTERRTKEAEVEKVRLEKVEKAQYTHCVKPGGAITTLRGVKGEGDGVKAGDLGGGKDAFDALTKSGYLVKR